MSRATSGSVNLTRMLTGSPEDQVLTFARMQTWVQPDGAKDRRLRSLLAERTTEHDGRLTFTRDPLPLGIVTWRPEPR